MHIGKYCVALFALLSSCAFSQFAVAQVKWDMPTPYTDASFQTQGVHQFVKEVAQGGKLQIIVHSNGTLLKHPEIKRAVQTGQVQIGEINISVLSNENPLFAFDSNPFLATGYEQEKKLWAVAKPYIEKLLDSQGIKLLYSVPWPPQALLAKKDIRSATDMKGLKFRTYNPISARLAELLGSVPTTVQMPEVPQAFRTGVVDVMITSAPASINMQVWDYLTHFYDAEIFLPQNVVFANKAAFAKLDAVTQKAMIEAAARAEQRGWEASRRDNQSALKELAEKGIKVGKPSAKFAAELAAVGKTISAEWAKRAGAEGAAILRGFNR